MTADTRTGRRGNRPLEVRMPKAERELDAAIAASIGTTVPDVVRAFLRYWRGETDELPPRPEVTRHDLCAMTGDDQPEGELVIRKPG